jgi:hypothetical protein
MGFLKIVRPPVVQEGESTESVVRRAISLCGADGTGASGSNRLQDILRERDDVFDVVNLLIKSLDAKPTRRELSAVQTLDDLVALFEAYRRKKADAG